MKLEHINVTVPDPKGTASILQDLFDWHIRWEGEALDDGYTVHVGDAGTYLALYAPAHEVTGAEARYRRTAGLNHIGIVVDNIQDTENRVRNAGYTPHNHADYEPGTRFYFDGPDGIEYEVVSYA